MNLVIATAEQAFKQFLYYIKKEENAVVPPDLFNPFINDIQIDWVKTKLPRIEFTQKIMDDLSLKVITDGVIQPVLTSVGENTFQLPVSGSEEQGGNTFATYLHGLTVEVRINADSSWEPAFVLRSDKRAIKSKNPYRSGTLYFERFGDLLRVNGPTDQVYTEMMLSYIKYPREYFYDEENPEDNNSNTSHIPGNGSVNFELSPAQRLEIVRLAARKHLGIEEDQRYNQILGEEMSENIN